MLIVLVVGAIAATIFLVGRETLRGPRSAFARFDHGMQTKYDAIRIGSQKTDVLAALGQPLRNEPRFCLPQQHGFETLFEEAERSASTEYYLWINGINWYYCVGFERNGAVSMKGEGHS